MIQVCDPPRTRQVRRLSTEEFCQLVRGEVSCVYRPRSEVLRMLTVGEAWGTGGVRGAPGAGCILLPMDADVAAAAALRRFLGWGCTAGGYFLTPAAGPDSRAAGTLAPLLAAAAAGAAGRGVRRALAGFPAQELVGQLAVLTAGGTVTAIVFLLAALPLGLWEEVRAVLRQTKTGKNRGK